MPGGKKKTKTDGKKTVNRAKKVNLKVKIKKSVSRPVSSSRQSASPGSNSQLRQSAKTREKKKKAKKQSKRRIVLKAIKSRGLKKDKSKGNFLAGWPQEEKKQASPARTGKAFPALKRDPLSKIRSKQDKNNSFSSAKTKAKQGMPNKITQEKVERDKRLMMWSGVAFFMILITFIWLYNTKQIFKQSATNNNKDFPLTDWNKMTDEIGEKMKQMKSNLENIKSFSNTGTGTSAALFNTAASSTDSLQASSTQKRSLFPPTTKSATTTDTETKLDQKKLNELMEKLKKLKEL